MGLFAIQSPRLPQVASAREDPTRPALCRLLDRPDGPRAVRRCQLREDSWLIPRWNLQKQATKLLAAIRQSE
jgi:hypothetical protein